MKYITLKKNKGCGRIILLSFLCMYVNNPFYFSAIEKIHKVVYYCIALYPVIHMSFRCNIIMKRDVFNYIKYIVFYVICAYMVTIISGSYDMQYMIYFFRHFLGIMSMYSIYMLWLDAYKRNKISIHFDEIYIISLIIYIFSTIFFLIIPVLKSSWLSIIVQYGNNEVLVERPEYVTRIGLAGFSGFGIAFQIVIGLVYYASMYVNKRLTFRKKVLYLAVLLLGCMFYGRVGTMVGMAVLVIIVAYAFICKKKVKLLLAILCLISFAGGVMAGIYKYASGPAKNFVDWAFEPVINYINDGTFLSASTSDLEQFYQQFNPSEEILLLGTGYWMNDDGSYYGYTDVGFMRNIYYGGVIYTIITYGCVFYLFFLYYKLSKKYKYKGRGLILSLCVFIFTLFEMKGDSTFLFVQAFLPLYLEVYHSSNNIISLFHKNSI